MNLIILQHEILHLEAPDHSFDLFRPDWRKTTQLIHTELRVITGRHCVITSNLTLISVTLDKKIQNKVFFEGAPPVNG